MKVNHVLTPYFIPDSSRRLNVHVKRVSIPHQYRRFGTGCHWD